MLRSMGYPELMRLGQLAKDLKSVHLRTVATTYRLLLPGIRALWAPKHILLGTLPLSVRLLAGPQGWPPPAPTWHSPPLHGS